jgi:hypothetical protein
MISDENYFNSEDSFSDSEFDKVEKNHVKRERQTDKERRLK